jgi:hypothetical protein
MKVLDFGQRAVVKDGIGNRGIVVARQDHHGQRRSRDDGGGAIEQINRQAVAIEGVARQHHDVRAGVTGRGQDTGEAGGAVAAVQPRGVVVIQVQIGAVDDHDIAGRRRNGIGHGVAT